MSKPAANLQALADQLLLQHFSPPAVLVNDQGDILYISGRTGKYLEPAAGKANWNIFAMAREGLRFELGSAFQKALRQKEAVTVKGLRIEERRGHAGCRPHDPGDCRTGGAAGDGDDRLHRRDGVRRDKPRAEPCPDAIAAKPGRLSWSRNSSSCREDLQTTREEMQSSQEELKSTNEELQSTNEELQSTNEELTTSREEMQSLNEELQTVNAEQQSKMDELARINNDMRNLLNSTEIVTVFLDNDLHVRRFTSGANKLFKLIPGDVGRPLSDIASDLLYPGDDRGGAGGAAHPGLFGETDRHHRWSLVYGAHHALPHHGGRHRRGGDHLCATSPRPRSWRRNCARRMPGSKVCLSPEVSHGQRQGQATRTRAG